MLFERARRLVECTPALSCVDASILSTRRYSDSSLVLIQALLHMIIYCAMSGDPGMRVMTIHWTAMAVVWARQIGLNQEIEDVDGDTDDEQWEYYESRRRTWSVYRILDVFGSLTN